MIAQTVAIKLPRMSFLPKRVGDTKEIEQRRRFLGRVRSILARALNYSRLLPKCDVPSSSALDRFLVSAPGRCIVRCKRDYLFYMLLYAVLVVPKLHAKREIIGVLRGKNKAGTKST